MKSKILIPVLCGVILVLLAGLAFTLVLAQRQPEPAELLLSPTAAPTPTTAPLSTPSAAESAAASSLTPTPVPQEIDFDTLLAQNPEVVGYIRIDGTNVDYPILCRPTDDNYYLNHTIDGHKALQGSIYLQGSLNRPDFTSFLTILYGHNMKDGSMFASLHNFEDRTFFDTHSEIIVYTPTRRLTYTIFAAYQRDNQHQMALFDPGTAQGRQDFLADAFAQSGFFREGITVTPEDRILSLSTCIGNANYRYVVQAVLTEDVPAE